MKGTAKRKIDCQIICIEKGERGWSLNCVNVCNNADSLATPPVRKAEMMDPLDCHRRCWKQQEPLLRSSLSLEN